MVNYKIKLFARNHHYQFKSVCQFLFKEHITIQNITITQLQSQEKGTLIPSMRAYALAEKPGVQLYVVPQGLGLSV